MSIEDKPLGDPHNFGRRVSKKGAWVEKPRPFFWEWLFLSNQSPLRQKYAHTSEEANPFQYFPNLEFKASDNGDLWGSNLIEFYQEEIDSETDMSGPLGKLLAVTIFFGLTDLHIENIKFSTLKNQPHCFPIDIETVFDHLNLTSQSYLLKSATNMNDLVGVNKLNDQQIKLPQLIEFFFYTIEVLNKDKNAIVKTLEPLELDTIPLRRIIRPTKTYFEFLNSPDQETNFYPEEIEQLNRGDIPYFFSYLGKKELYYLTESGPTLSKINWSDVIFHNVPNSSSTAALLRNIEDSTLKPSILQIARTFDPGQDLEWQNEFAKILYKEKNIFIKLSNQWKLACKRI